MNIKEQIIKQIQKNGDIPFTDYMQQALYDPKYGYYTSGLPKFGIQGDFVTAPELTPLFGQTLANQCQQILSVLSNPVMLEFGAGSGKLAIDILQRLQELDALPQEYLILEISGSLRARQQERIEDEIPHLANRVKWLTQWPSLSFEGVLVANEVLDAMPVHRFMRTENGLCESYITVSASQELQETYKPCTNSRLTHYIYKVFPHQIVPYQSEANLFIEGWLNECFRLLKKGALLMIDYGFPRHEFYHADRASGTLMCHHQHEAHTNPLANPGEEDITAHVDFTQVAECGFDAGFNVSGYTNQAAFLLANGLLALLDAIQDEKARFRAQQAVKQLVQPSEMGELFKVMALTKEIDLDLIGFQLQDKRVSL